MSGISRPSGIAELHPRDLLAGPPTGAPASRRPLSHHGVMGYFGRSPAEPPAAAAPDPPPQRARLLSANRPLGGGGFGPGGPTDAGLALALSAKLDALALRIRTVDARSQMLLQPTGRQDEVRDMVRGIYIPGYILCTSRNIYSGRNIYIYV